MFCPNCAAILQGTETECPICHVSLGERGLTSPGLPDSTIVPVFKTDDPGIVPLATLALEQEQIEYLIRPVPRTATTELFVASDVADKARDILADLENPSGGAAAASELATVDVPEAPASAEDLGVELQNAETGMSIGQISEAQLQFLTSHLEAESSTDQDYYIDAATIDLLEASRGDARLIDLLRRAVGEREGMEIRWLVP